MTRWQLAAAALWLVLLVAYVLAGTALTPFHGDESMQIHSSGDFATLFLERNPAALGANLDVELADPSSRRLLEGTINNWTVGLAWYLAGYHPSDLPPQPGWLWGEDYDRNIAHNMRPPQALLLSGRLPSTLFFAASVPVLFGIAWCFGGYRVAWIASGLYTLHPALLLNGRRAMMEGPMLFFGLLTVLFAGIMIRRGHFSNRRWWLALALGGGLALASKHTAVLFLAGALGWLWTAALLKRDRRQLLATTLSCALCGLLALAVFLVLSPALWPGPPQLLPRVFQLRNELAQNQARALLASGSGMALTERIDQVLTQPFLRPPMFFEVPQWSEYEVIRAEIDAWLASPLSGLQPGAVTGLALSLFALAGLVPALRQPGRAGLVVWLGLTVVALLFNPLPWQRYYLPLLPIAILLAATAMAQLLELSILVIKRRYGMP